MSEIWIVIPAYNEEKKLGAVIKDLKKHGYHNIVVVNDCSKDNTEKVAINAGAVALSHFTNRGQGAAIETGNEYALRQGADVIVHFDADGQMQAEDIPAMIKPLLNKTADVTIGSRFLGKETNAPRSKKIILFLGNLFLRFVYGVKVSDPQCGFRAVSAKGVGLIGAKQNNGGEHASEVLINIFKNKIKYQEVPVTIIYTEYSKQHTQHGKFQLLSGIKIAVRTIIKRLLK